MLTGDPLMKLDSHPDYFYSLQQPVQPCVAAMLQVQVVLEMPHRHKDDAPSGTATTLGEILLDVRNQQKDALRHGREQACQSPMGRNRRVRGRSHTLMLKFKQFKSPPSTCILWD